mgnify:CR=1 FL=1
MADLKQTEEQVLDQWRESLKDLEPLLEKLCPLCKSPDELYEIVSMARSNDGLLKMLMMTVAAKR